MRGQGVSSLQWFVCEVCGIQYQRRVCVGEASRYCSVKCKGKAQTQRSLDSHPHYTCQHCGNRFFDIRHPSEKTFCSRECSFAFKASKCKGCGKRLAPKAMSEWCVDCKERVCPICGKMFSGRIGKLTCSDECRLQYGKQDARRYYAARKPLKQRICKECGQTFVPEYGDKRRGFCSVVIGITDELVRRLGERAFTLMTQRQSTQWLCSRVTNGVATSAEPVHHASYGAHTMTGHLNSTTSPPWRVGVHIPTSTPLVHVAGATRRRETAWWGS
jgi:hypothetical protein